MQYWRKTDTQRKGSNQNPLLCCMTSTYAAKSILISCLNKQRGVLQTKLYNLVSTQYLKHTWNTHLEVQMQQHLWQVLSYIHSTQVHTSYNAAPNTLQPVIKIVITTITVLRPFVRDYPGKLVPEETFTHPPSWSSSNLYQLLPSTMIHSILPVQITCLAIFLQTSLHVLFGLPLVLKPSTSYSIHFFTQWGKILLLHYVPHSIGGDIVATVKTKLRPFRVITVIPCCFAVSVLVNVDSYRT